jgi:hypothetical protein
VSVVAQNDGDHADLVGIYLAFVPPGGVQNIGGCSPSSVSRFSAKLLQPGNRITIVTDPAWQCADPALVKGLSWTLYAIADVHADDFSSCATIQQVLGGGCATGLADDDDRPSDNFEVRIRPRVVAVKP